MPSLKKVAAKVATRFKEHSQAQHRATLFVKIALITIPATLIVVAQSFDLAHANHEMSAWTIAGIAAAGLVLLGGLYVLWTEKDVSETLDNAREAVETARVYLEEKEEFERNIARLNVEVRRGLELYNIMDVMRGAIEQSADLPSVSVAGILQTFLTAARDSLLVAFAHDPDDTWTTCIYEARDDAESGKVVLHCVAHDRTMMCDLSQARSWQEGNGVVGVAYSQAHVIVIPDMQAPDLGTAFDLREKGRPYDRQRYRSMVAAPIMVGSEPVPWGVAVATSSRPHHFSDVSADGVPTSAPIRAIAAMAGLAVKSLAKAQARGSSARNGHEPVQIEPLT